MPGQASPVALKQVLNELVDAAQRVGSVASQVGQIGVAPARTTTATATGSAPDLEAVSLATTLSPVQHEICERVINVFETGRVEGKYDAISIFEDGPHDVRQITYGRSQTTEYGNLRELVQMYIEARGQFAGDLREFVDLIGRTPLVDNSRFKNLLRESAQQDAVMRQTQDVFFDRRYFKPAMRWAGENGFSRALSALVIYDSYIHSGSILPLLRSRFSELPPARGGNEEVWIQQYVDVRHDWLLHHHRPAVRSSAYRTRDLAREIARNNWDLSLLPIMANGTAVNAGTMAMIALESDDDIPFLGNVSELPAAAEEHDEMIVGDASEEIWSDDSFAAGVFALEASANIGNTPASLASTILESSRISLATVHTSGIVDQANARQNIADTANGGRARRSSYGTAPGGSVMLDKRLLGGLVTLSQHYSFAISELAGGSHNSSSRHYAGIAADFNIVNGRRINASHPDLAAFKARLRDLGATEVLGPGTPHHSTHVHAAWPRLV